MKEFEVENISAEVLQQLIQIVAGVAHKEGLIPKQGMLMLETEDAVMTGSLMLESRNDVTLAHMLVEQAMRYLIKAREDQGFAATLEDMMPAWGGITQQTVTKLIAEDKLFPSGNSNPFGRTIN